MPQETTRSVKLRKGIVRQLFDDKGRPTVIADFQPGDVIDLPVAEAARFIERGYASANEK